MNTVKKYLKLSHRKSRKSLTSDEMFGESNNDARRARTFELKTAKSRFS